MMMCCPSSSVTSVARFVTTAAIGPETLYIYTCIPRSGDLADQILVLSDSWLGH
jgi:hypothetical protein